MAASRALYVTPHLEGLSYGERQIFLGKGRPIPEVWLQRTPPGGQLGQGFGKDLQSENGLGLGAM